MEKKFEIEAVGNNVIIDPLPEAYKGKIELLETFDKEQLIVNPEGVLVSVGNKVKDYFVGNKVVFKMGIAQPHFYRKKLYYIIDAKELVARLPKDYVLQSREDAEYLEKRSEEVQNIKQGKGIIQPIH